MLVGSSGESFRELNSLVSCLYFLELKEEPFMNILLLSFEGDGILDGEPTFGYDPFCPNDISSVFY